jgi:hypothetical protein
MNEARSGNLRSALFLLAIAGTVPAIAVPARLSLTF